MAKHKHFLSLSDYSSVEIKLLLDAADEIKKHPRRFRRALKGQILAMVFETSSTRAQVSFEAGMHRLGGVAQFLSSRDIQLGHGESVSDTAAVLSRYVDAIVARTFADQTMLDLAQHATVPVINGFTDLEHPCQVLADLQTIREKFGKLEGLKFTYLGAGNNVAHSILQGTGRTGMDCTIITPPDPKYQCDSEIVEAAREDHERQGTRLILTDDLHAVQGSHVVYTDTWISTGHEAEKEEREAALGAYTVNLPVMEAAGKNAIFMHCLPACRGAEVIPEVIDGPQSVIYDQAENLMWSQMAVMYLLMGE